MTDMTLDEAMVEAVARAICVTCKENPDRQGDERGNEFRWQDYRDTALAAISAFTAAQQPATTMTNHQSMRAADCCGCGPKHYEYEVWQGDALQAGGREADYASAQSEANHYAMMYAQDGPVEVIIYEKRLITWIPSMSSSRLGEEDQER